MLILYSSRPINPNSMRFSIVSQTTHLNGNHDKTSIIGQLQAIALVNRIMVAFSLRDNDSLAILSPIATRKQSLQNFGYILCSDQI